MFKFVGVLVIGVGATVLAPLAYGLVCVVTLSGLYAAARVVIWIICGS